jgi:heterodisulfide reductase subunit C
MEDIFARLGANLDGDGPGVLRKIPSESLEELDRIFEVTGGKARFEMIEKASARKAAELGMSDEEYYEMVFTQNSGRHFK